MILKVDQQVCELTKVLVVTFFDGRVTNIWQTLNVKLGATTLSITTFSIMTLDNKLVFDTQHN